MAKKPDSGNSSDISSRPATPAQTKATNTFLINVQFQRNSTWQGTIQYPGRNKKVNFRSALEMLKIMDEVISGNEKPKEKSAEKK